MNLHARSHVCRSHEDTRRNLLVGLWRIFSRVFIITKFIIIWILDIYVKSFCEGLIKVFLCRLLKIFFEIIVCLMSEIYFPRSCEMKEKTLINFFSLFYNLTFFSLVYQLILSIEKQKKEVNFRLIHFIIITYRNPWCQRHSAREKRL